MQKTIKTTDLALTIKAIAHFSPDYPIYLGLKDGPIVAIEDVSVTVDPEGNPCVILYESEE